ncbi:MAG: type IV toxin-antitoxin system AbiEi family antitoxin domain-containing protein [Thermodesulfobacteriota bacterium]
MPAHSVSLTAAEKALLVIKKSGGMIRTGEALSAGIHPRVLYALRDQGKIEQMTLGVYRLSELPPVANPDLVTVALRVPRAVICLVSALSFHHLTTQIPHEVAIALERGTESPRIDFPPVSVHRFSREAFQAGIEEHEVDGVMVRVYGPEKTIADCFKFRNRLGMDVVLEALKLCKENRRFKADELLRFGRVCRVTKVMKPYLEAMV